MTEIVIVPAWKRPAFLAAALRRLVVADEPGLHYWLALDRGHTRETLTVAVRFVERIGAQRAKVVQRMHPYRGNSYNILSCYKEAIEAQYEMIHLVEDDIFVGRDYFGFHRAAHALAPDAFAVSACRNQNYGHDPHPIEDAIYRGVQYQSIGVSFRPDKLALVLPHMVGPYFHNPVQYCRSAFPRSAIPQANAEQDGLLNRIVEAGALPVVYAHRPRAYHAGFVGYHRNGAALQGSIEVQADQLLAMNTEQLNAAAYTYPDHQAVDLDVPLGPVTRVIPWP